MEISTDIWEAAVH